MFIHVLVKASVCIKCTLSIQIQRTVCDSVCEGSCVSGRCGHHAKSSLLILLFRHSGDLSKGVLTLWPPGTGSLEERALHPSDSTLGLTVL